MRRAPGRVMPRGFTFLACLLAVVTQGCGSKSHPAPTQVAEFEGDIDPVARTFSLRMVKQGTRFASVQEIPVGVAGTGAAGTVELVAEKTSMDATNPIACGRANSFCADVTIRWFSNPVAAGPPATLPQELHNVFIELTEITPPTGGLGIANTAQPAGGQPGAGQVHSTYGLWEYPALLDSAASDPGTNAATRRWYFDNLTSQSHHFTGRVMADLVTPATGATGPLATCGDAATSLSSITDCGECGRTAPAGTTCSYQVVSGTSAIAFSVACQPLPGGPDGSGGQLPDIPLTACDTASSTAYTCLDLNSDVRNCGVCGNDCGSGTCTNGTCSAAAVRCLAADTVCGAKCCPAGSTCSGTSCVLTDAVEIAVGLDRACATTNSDRVPRLSNGGTATTLNNVVCWGKHYYTEFGQEPSFYTRGQAVAEGFAGNDGNHLFSQMERLAVGTAYSIAQLPYPPLSVASDSARLWGPGWPTVNGWNTRAMKFALGGQHGCAPFHQGAGDTTPEAMYCWGENISGALGVGGTGGANPVPVPEGTGASSTCTPDGENGRCMVVSVDGTLYDDGGGLSATDVSAGGDSTCVVLAAPATRGQGQTAGDVACWGENTSGQVTGTAGTGAYSLLPQVVAGVHGATQVSVGGTHSVALVGSDTLAFWGDNASGQFGTTKTGTVTTLTPGGIISAVTAGEGFTCYLSSGTVYCAGRNDLGQLGRGTVGGTGVTFLPVLNVPAATALSAGGKGGSVGGVTSPRGRYATLGSACARTGSGQVYCWGDDSQGQLGRGLSAGPSGDPALVELEPTDPLP